MFMTSTPGLNMLVVCISLQLFLNIFELGSLEQVEVFKLIYIESSIGFNWYVYYALSCSVVMELGKPITLQKDLCSWYARN